MLRRWLSRWTHRKPHPRRRPARGWRPAVEALETRWLPAAVTIPTLDLVGTPGGTVRVPVLIDDADMVRDVELSIAYDASKLELRPEDLRVGTATADFVLAADFGAGEGTFQVVMSRDTPLEGFTPGSLLLIDFRVRADAGAGETTINLRADTRLNRGLIPLDPAPLDEAGDPADGVVRITGDGATSTTFRLTGFPSPTTAGQPGTFTLTVLDAMGNPRTDYTGTVHFTSSDPQALLPDDFTFTADDKGTRTFEATFRTAGVQSLTATDTADPALTATQSGITVTAAQASQLVVSGVESPTPAGVARTFTVTAQDAFGNTATGYTGTVTFASSDPQAVLPPDYTFTPADQGVHVFPNGVTFRTPGTQLLKASDAADPAVTGMQEDIVVTPAQVSTITVTGFPSPVTAGTAGTVTVTVRDTLGNIATGYTGTVRLTSSDPQAVLPDEYTFTEADEGVHTFDVTLRMAGTQSITAADTADPALSGSQANITVNPAAAARLAVTAPGTASLNTPFSVTVTAQDAFGNTATGYTGTVRLTSSDSQAVLPADFTFTAADNGVHVFPGVTLRTAGTQTVTATDTANADITGTSGDILVTAASRIVVSGFPATTTAGQQQMVTVTVVDAAGNPVPSYTGTVRFTSTDPQAQLPENFTFTAADNGTRMFMVTLRTAGAQSITVTDTGLATITGTQSGITVNPAAASTLVVSGFPSPSLTGAPGTFTVTARDAFGNTATGYRGTVRFTSSDPQAVLPPDYTFTAADNGVHVFTSGATFRTAGTQSLTATDTATATITGTQANITVNQAAAVNLVVTGFPSPTTAGVAGTFTVTVRDAQGNVLTSYRGTVRFTSTDPQAVLPANYTFTAADNGVHVFTNGATLRTAGTQSITVTDTATATITGTQSGITVNAAAASTLAVSGVTSPATAGVAQTFTVTARDAFGNTAAGYTGTVRFTSTDPQAQLPADVTFTAADNGVRTFTNGVTFRTAGTQSLTARDTTTATITGTQSNITVNPAAASTLIVSGFPSPTTTGTAGTFTVTARDAFGNTATGYRGTVRFTSSDPQAQLPANYTFTAADNGVHVFTNGATFRTAGTQSLTATDTATATITGTQAGIVVNAATTQNERLVNQMYLDVLGRAAEPAGLAFWVGQLNQGVSRVQVGLGITTSREALTRQVQQLFQTLLGRPADGAALNTNLDYLLGGGSLQQLKTVILASPEYYRRAGGTNEAYVAAMYRDVLGRVAEQAGGAYFLRLLNKGKRREVVAGYLVGSLEERTDVAQALYQQYLRRPGDAAGVANVVGLLARKFPEANIVAILLGSDEYAGRVR